MVTILKKKAFILVGLPPLEKSIKYLQTDETSQTMWNLLSASGFICEGKYILIDSMDFAVHGLAPTPLNTIENIARRGFLSNGSWKLGKD